MEDFVELVLLVKTGLHNKVHGGVAHLVHNAIIKVAAEEAVLYALTHEHLRMGRLLLLALAEKRHYPLIFVHFGEEQRID